MGGCRRGGIVGTFNNETRSAVSSSVSPEILSTISEILGFAAAAEEFHRRGWAAVGASLSAGEATAVRARREQHLDARAIAVCVPVEGLRGDSGGDSGN